MGNGAVATDPFKVKRNKPRTPGPNATTAQTNTHTKKTQSDPNRPKDETGAIKHYDLIFDTKQGPIIRAQEQSGAERRIEKSSSTRSDSFGVYLKSKQNK